MKKEVKEAIANINVVVANVPMKRDEHLQLMNDVRLVGEQCDIAAVCKCDKKKAKK